MSRSGKTLLVWDIDDVLNLLMEQFAVSQHISVGDLTENPPHKILQISKEEYLSKLDSVRMSGFYDLPPRPETMAFFEEHGDEFCHVALSAVPLRFMEDSSAWVLHHFGAWIQSVFFIPSKRQDRRICSQLFSSKADVMLALGPDAVLIDDSPQNVESVREAGGKSLLFPAPWNDRRDLSTEKFFSRLKGLSK